jgi:general stress protein CsbA
MNKNSITAIILVSIMMLTSCHRGYRTTTLVVNSDKFSMKIKYAGQIIFNDDSTAIKSISPEGYLIYRKNEKELTAESDPKGQLTVELYDDGKKMAFDDNGKKIMADAVKEMIVQGIGQGNKTTNN